jgi:hypothetical protein
MQHDHLMVDAFTCRPGGRSVIMEEAFSTKKLLTVEVGNGARALGAVSNMHNADTAFAST